LELLLELLHEWVNGVVDVLRKIGVGPHDQFCHKSAAFAGYDLMPIARGQRDCKERHHNA
jgi:hypothetical protein